MADFENTVDRGSAVIFDADSGLCRSFVWILGPKQNLDHRSFFSLRVHPDYFFFRRSSYELRCETVIGIVLCYSHQECCLLYYLDEINSGIHLYQVTFELYTSVFGCGCSFGFEPKFWRIDGFDEKRHGSADLHTPIHPPREDNGTRATVRPLF